MITVMADDVLTGGPTATVDINDRDQIEITDLAGGIVQLDKRTARTVANVIIGMTDKMERQDGGTIISVYIGDGR